MNEMSLYDLQGISANADAELMASGWSVSCCNVDTGHSSLSSTCHDSLFS
ncbi:hypothetical protein ITP53_04170 [Nonomuraea sp. K274]|uniref:Uncharacterized protein n=1 Tax=Nonomuraea cypriaca TaxID=1187855 RepID=A0A931A2C6_9ACTN|nr:hypothetical protein [Nonomuraea cypriaca]MBF8184947.1 hypothetical protein [Nonomuraea cypriaca]